MILNAQSFNLGQRGALAWVRSRVGRSICVPQSGMGDLAPAPEGENIGTKKCHGSHSRVSRGSILGLTWEPRIVKLGGLSQVFWPHVAKASVRSVFCKGQSWRLPSSGRSWLQNWERDPRPWPPPTPCSPLPQIA